MDTLYSVNAGTVTTVRNMRKDCNLFNHSKMRCFAFFTYYIVRNPPPPPRKNNNNNFQRARDHYRESVFPDLFYCCSLWALGSLSLMPHAEEGCLARYIDFIWLSSNSYWLTMKANKSSLHYNAHDMSSTDVTQ